MSRFGGMSEERPSVFKTRSKLGTHLSNQYSGDERQSRPYPARKIPCKIGEIGNMIEEVVDLARQINLKVYSEDAQELMHFHSKKLTIDVLKEMHEQERDIELKIQFY
ncbi:hypothetical protein TNCV_3823411 [Trichonephila clavipes]|nr:hypothetical protein TNCV_3823411 [Trichonephila clavipes]